MAVIGARRCAA